MSSDETIDTTVKLAECLQNFIDHVERLRNEDDPSGDGFTREFKEIRDLGIRDKENNTYPSDHGRLPYNIKKNRYKDILPYDEHRVTLDPIEGEDGSDYINASFIQDQHGKSCYIASQGPNPLTVYDFWRMLLQHKVKVVAMACKLIEMGRKKCEQYWPEAVNETMQLNDISITMIKQDVLAENCVIRSLAVKKGSGPLAHIKQFHYSGWPDHGIPTDFDIILEMMAEMRELKSADPERAPMVIHCSAGCGRTGTICAIDYSWDVLKSGSMDENFDLNQLVKVMRQQRPSMIQTPEQYMMAHVTVQTLFQKHLSLMEDHIYGNVTLSQGEVKVESGASRKNSCLQTDIENTLKTIGKSPSKEVIYGNTDPPMTLPEPLVPNIAATNHSQVGPKPPLPQKPSIANSGHPSLESKTSSDQSDGGGISKGRTSSFKVQRIDNIPNSDKNPRKLQDGIPNSDKNPPKSQDGIPNSDKNPHKSQDGIPNSDKNPHKSQDGIPNSDRSPQKSQDGIEMRYSTNLRNDHQTAEKTLSYVSTEDGKNDLKAKTAMFENNRPLSQPPSTRKSGLQNQTSVHMNSNTVINKPNSDSKPVQPANNTKSATLPQKPIHVTKISIGGAGGGASNVIKTAVERTVSTPHNNVTPPAKPPHTKAQTLPSKATPNFHEPPQSSIPPSTSTTADSGSSIYSMADNNYSPISNYSSGPQSKKTTNTTTTETDTYSCLSNYSCPGSANSQTLTNSIGYSYPTVHMGDQTNRSSTGSDIYSSVNKAGNSVNEACSNNDYDTVVIGKGNHDTLKTPPPIPERKYLEDEKDVTNTQTINNSSTGRLREIMNNVFAFNLGNKGNVNISTAEIPGYGNKMEKKPHGSKETPATWKKKTH